MDDLSSAQITISALKSLILFYQDIIQTIIDRLKEILNLIELVQTNNQSQNSQLQDITNQLNTLIESQQNIQNTNTNITQLPRIVQINKPNYAARIVE
jgi:methyl-accepting chemotaxis protein